jgi:hypothetical protein
MKPTRLAAVVGCVLVAAATPMHAQQDTTRHPMTLRITSAVPGREMAFKAAFFLDPAAGLQHVEGRTPFEAKAVAPWAVVLIEDPAGGSNLQAELRVATANDAHETVSAGSGPRLVLSYNPMRQRLEASSLPDR